jgi:hypothetical protein
MAWRFGASVSTLVAVVVAMHGCGGSPNGSDGASGSGGGIAETTCRKLRAVTCFDSVFDECVPTLREAVDTAVALGCGNEVEAGYGCLGDSPNFDCEGDRPHYNGNCDAEAQALDNCQRNHPNFCEVEWGAGSCQECWCAACPCDAACIAGRSAVTACAADCEDEDCARVCLDTVGGTYAQYTDCANEAAAGGGACAAVCP